MGLTDPLLPWVLGVAALLLFLIVIIFWSRFARSGVLWVLLRITSLVTLNILVISTIGVAANNYGGFYTSWRELLGQKEKPPLIVTRDDVNITKIDIQKSKRKLDGSVVLRRLVRGVTSGITAEVYISLPPSYVKSVELGEKVDENYPIIMFLPGYPGHAAAWLNGMQIVERETRLKQEGKIPEVISILPEINVSGKFDAECMNVDGGPQVESWLANDVVTFTSNWLSLKPHSWRVVGYSTGGWCATMLALRHPTQFAVAASIAGYYKPQPAKQLSVAEKIRLENEYDLYSTISRQKSNIALLVINPIGDKNSHLATSEFLKKVKPPIRTSEIILEGAGHNFTTWRKVIDSVITWTATEQIAAIS